MTTADPHAMARSRAQPGRTVPAGVDPAASLAALWLREHGVENPCGVVVFGSGWSPLEERAEVIERWPYERVPGLPPTSVKGHPGRLVWARWRGEPCLLFVGRWHVYEGRSPHEAALPGMIAAALGCRWLFCTNAAGGVADGLRIGQLVAITDDIGLWSGYRHGKEFFSEPRPGYSLALLGALFDASRKADVPLGSGVLAMMPGPNYETAAEIRMLRMAGASVVSMSTVPEARCARAFGVEVAALSCVTNLAPARPDFPLAHDDVLDILKATRNDAGKLLDTWLEHPAVRSEVPR